MPESPSKRNLSPSPASSRSITPAVPPRKRLKPSTSHPPILHHHTIFVLPPKLDQATIHELHQLVDRSGARLVSRAEDADTILTAIGMRKRLERHLDWDVAKSKAVLKPSWLRDSVAQGRALPCRDYVALRDLATSTGAHCPTHSDSGASPSASSTRGHGPAPPRNHNAPEPPKDLLPPEVPYSAQETSPTARFSCERATPLVCVNQALCEYLDIIRRGREVEGEERSALSYRRAIAVTFPRKIDSRTRRDVQKLPNLGAKLLNMIDEYVDTGRVQEIEAIRSSERFKALVDFSAVYGIGPTTARHLYFLGLRNLRELEVYYEVDHTPDSLVTVLGDGDGSRIARAQNARAAQEERDATEAWIAVALKLRHDLAIKIPRSEVEAIHRTIVAELDAVQPGCVSTVVGGYRRGKAECGDVDTVFTHPDPETVKGLCAALVGRLRAQGRVTHVLHLSRFHPHNPLRHRHWDSLEKALTVFVAPGTALRRRVDLIFAPPETYWTAVVGWTGSQMFERDLRSVAKKQGMKFDSSGITRRRDSRLFYPRSEKAVFDLFGLPWIDPTLRNADC
ncbi:Nucleotidyltransferase [Amylostereum chailletii]|nr:Nucleotidyltransferase [Amylostereum chailletii]